MTDTDSIALISKLLENPAALSSGDHDAIAILQQSYPYFVPAHYLAALERHRQAAFSPAMLSEVSPYLGNWILFCDFLKAGSQEAKKTEDQPKTKKELSKTEGGKEASKVEAASIAVDGDGQNHAAASTTHKPEAASAPVEAAPVVAEKAKHESIADITPPVVAAIVADEIQIPLREAPIEEAIVIPEEVNRDEQLVFPVYTEDYFAQQGLPVSAELPLAKEDLAGKDYKDKSLMVMMSFSEWLLHFKNTAEKQEEEKRDKKSLRTMWQKEKLAAAMEEENEEIPENVFEMAVNSIASEDGLASESLADIYLKQGKYDKAIEMYRKLSLRNPKKNAYFALKIEEILKEKQS